MNSDRKATIYQKMIDELESEVSRLKRENLYLLQLVPNTEKVKEMQDLVSEHQAALDELTELKEKYKSVLCEIKTLKKSYKTEMDRLLYKLKNKS